MNRLILFISALLLSAPLWAQVAGGDVLDGDISDITASGSRLLCALVAGILLAFAFQSVIATLSSALGITVTRRAMSGHRRQKSLSPRQERREERQEHREERREERRERHGEPAIREVDEERPAWEKPALKIQAAAGFWVLLTTCISVFCACWLASELTGFVGRKEAVILGLSVWAGFFLTMAWLEARAVGTLLSGLSSAIKGGFQAIAEPLKAAGGMAAEKAVASSDDIAAKVRQEFRENSGGFQEKFRDYMSHMSPKRLDHAQVRNQVDDILRDSEVEGAAREGLLPRLDRSKFREIIDSRGDIPEDEARELTDVLHDSWNSRVSVRREERSPASAPSDSGEEMHRLQEFRDFLRNTDKRELNPHRIEQEVEVVVSGSPANFAGLKRSADAITRNEMVAVLRQRRDITLEEADSVGGLIEAARTSALSAGEAREHRSQEIANRALARIRDHIYSLKRPGPDYEEFRQDFSKMLDDPKQGLESLKAKAPEMNRESLVTLISERKGVTREEAEKMADQGAQALAKAREKAHQVEEETHRRVEQAKQATFEQAESARKLAASAAWWMFAIAVCTAAAAALGGLVGALT